MHLALVWVLILFMSFTKILISNAGQSSQWNMLYVSGEMKMHEAVNAGLRMVDFKDMLSEVGLAYREVIHSSTPEALEKVC